MTTFLNECILRVLFFIFFLYILYCVSSSLQTKKSMWLPLWIFLKFILAEQPFDPREYRSKIRYRLNFSHIIYGWILWLKNPLDRFWNNPISNAFFRLQIYFLYEFLLVLVNIWWWNTSLLTMMIVTGDDDDDDDSCTRWWWWWLFMYLVMLMMMIHVPGDDDDDDSCTWWWWWW